MIHGRDTFSTQKAICAVLPYIFYTTRPNSMSQKAGSEYEEIVITNYDPRLYNSARHWQLSIFNLPAADEDDGRYTLIHEPETKSHKTEERR